ncbi:UNVERIFIED_CONTAM: Ribosome biogenesis protein BOP1 [Sesamum angustifolium]|uniref:Ribosome biogenesis protein BOP1 n=1 Tax=Sesamum angustifolium TaxID=2727405 RepID=A0AAW2QCF3_9LAMI
MGPKPRKENGSGKPKNEKAEKKVQKLKAKIVEENLKRIEEAEAAAESSEDSPFVSDSGEDDDESLSEDNGSLSESGSEQSKLSEDEVHGNSQFGFVILVINANSSMHKDVVRSSDGDDPTGARDGDTDHLSGYSLGEGDDNDDYHGEDSHGGSDDSREVVEESDSSEDEVAPRNTIGNVPLEWYKDEEHIGYDLAGKKIKKKERQSKLDSFLASVDDSKNWHTSLRSVPAYEKAVQETFDRCLDLYLCPRVRKKRINIDPESLKPKLPSRKDLKPYPNTCYLEYKGHKGPVTTICTESTGQWIASGSKDGTVRIWEVETGRCLQVWDIGETIEEVAWNPLTEFPILAIAAGQDVFILDTGCGRHEQNKIEELLHVEPQKATDDSDTSASIVNWVQDDRHGGIRLKHFKTVTKVEWHRKGDYLSTLMPSDILFPAVNTLVVVRESRSVLIHQLSKRLTQRIPFKTKGIPVSTAFHPTRSIFFTATKKDVRVYDLLKQKLIKKLDAGVREISSIAIHPGGDNAIVGSKDGKLCWFDMDLSSRPYRVLRCHPKDITGVAYHRSYPLFASCSDDCTAYVFHGMVYSDLNQNPLIVPLEILRGHSGADGRGVLDCKFHPRQPWLFTAGQLYSATDSLEDNFGRAMSTHDRIGVRKELACPPCEPRN